MIEGLKNARHAALLLLFALLSGAALAQMPVEIDSVLVKKSEKTLYLLHEGQIIKRYPIMLGPKPKGHKLQEGDDRTPEGQYLLDFKNSNSRFYKSIRVSYPNAEDIERAHKFNVNPGNWIMIHGMKNSWSEKTAKQALKYNWTNGCIAVKNSDMDEIWDAVEVGTPIEIKP